MRRIIAITTVLAAFVLLSDAAQAQVRFNINNGGWGYGPGVTISVGTGNQNCGPDYRVYRQGYYRNQRPRYDYRSNPYYNNDPYCQNRGYWCQPHNQYCTHAPYAYNNQPYWCRAHREYCTHY